MILSDVDIKKSLKSGRVSIEPLFPDSIQPASVDLHLGNEFLVFKNQGHTAIDLKQPLDDMMERVIISEKKPFIIHPGEFALGLTYETVGVADDMVGRLEGKSSLGRVGLIIHATAGYLDPGNKLKMTLELHNIANLPIILYYKMPIAQLSFTPLSSKAQNAYGNKKLKSKYFGATKPQASQYYKNFKNNKWEKFK
ncbi:MAG: Deoxycytidine triphosphate deaminase [Candidatus Doudnabacteria bacterium]|nr:Deoxycytidine triphosphate deaminase [Candidatus Doudnabacteria bacterium]